MNIHPAIKYVLIIIGFILLLGVLWFFLLKSDKFQTFVGKKVATVLSDNLNTKIDFKSVKIKFFTKVAFDDIYIEDLAGDTMIFADELVASINTFSLVNRKISVSELRLTNPVINLVRPDTSEDYYHDIIFRGSKKEKKPKTNNGNSNKFDFELHRLVIDNTRLTMEDRLKKTALLVKLPHAIFELNDIGINTKKIDIKSATLSDPYVDMEILENSDEKVEELKDGHILKGDLQIWYDLVTLSNGHFKFRNNNKQLRGEGIEYGDLDIQDINLLVKGGHIIKDTIRADVKSLSAYDKSGFTLKNLSSNAEVSTIGILCNDLLLETPQSLIRNKLTFKYDSFADFKNFVSKVKMNGEFENSIVAVKDINYFANALGMFDHNIINLNGNVYGTVDNLKGKDLDAKIGDLVFKGKIAMDGLPNFKETFISLRVNQLKTRLRDIQKIYPEVEIPTVISNMGLIHFEGKFDGFPNDFVTEGYLLSDIGSARSDMNLKIAKESNNTSYSGNLVLNKFDIGKLVEEDEIGKVTLNAKLEGKGFTVERIDATLVGEVESVTFKDYNYKDIELNGRFKFKEFQGFAKIDDEDLQLDFNGIVNLKSDVPKFNFTSSIETANLKNLNFTKEDVVLKANVDFNMTGNSLNTLLGRASIKDLLVVNNNNKYIAKQMELISKTLTNGGKEIIIDSEVLKVRITGDYMIEEIPKAFKYYIDQFYDLPAPDTSFALKAPQKLNFEIEIPNSKGLPNLLSGTAVNINQANIAGSLNTKANEVSLNASISSLAFNNHRYKNISIQADGLQRKLNFKNYIENIFNKNGLLAQDINVDGVYTEDILNWHIALTGDTITNRVNMDGTFVDRPNAMIFSILPSQLFLNNEIWTFSEGNEVIIKDDNIIVNNLFINNEEQSLSVTSKLEDKKSTIFVTLDDVDLNKLFDAFTNSGEKIEGIANGTLVIDDVINDMRLSANVNVKGIEINDNKVGELTVNSRLDREKKKIFITGSLDGPDNSVDIKGNYSTAKDRSINISFSAESINLKPIGPFIKKYVIKPDGIAKASLSLGGTLKEPTLEGLVKLVNTEVTVPYIYTRYKVNEQLFRFKKEVIEFKNVELMDLEGNVAVANGEITHDNLKDWAMDIDVTTDKFQFLKTTKKENVSFYGTAFAQGNARFTGPFNDAQVYVNASTLDNTIMYLPLADDKDVGQYSFFTFVNSKKDTIETQFDNKFNNVKIILDLDVNPKAEVQIIFDESAGEILRGNGSGSVKINYESLGDLEIYGDVVLESGDYLFTLQNLVNKKFAIQKGGTISWLGDPYNALLNVKAVYNFRASPYNLIEEYLVDATSQQINSAKGRESSILFLILTGSLSNPNIEFDIKIENPDPALKTLIEAKLNLLENNTNELNKQVLGILVMNQFFPTLSENFSNPGDPGLLGSGVNNTVTEFLSNQLSFYLSDWIGTFVPGLELDFQYRYYDLSSENPDELLQNQKRSELYLALTKRFLKDRISVTAGGNIDFGQYTELERSTGLAGNIEIEYRLTEDGRWGLKAFSESEYDVFEQGNFTTAGVGLSYSQEFDTWRDLFDQMKRRKKSRKERKAEKRKDDARKEDETVQRR
ncbi:MAG: translocation/assembly module TamB [Chitinophagales bacterium]|nr:translocation/assembly module TamB [Chitinophagales bacterium]